MALSWDTVVGRSLEQNLIRELYLYQIPVLKTCDNWMAVKEVGKIDFHGKHSDYHGILVYYMNKLYFVSDSTVKALEPFRQWSLKKNINVISEKDYNSGR